MGDPIDDCENIYGANRGIKIFKYELLPTELLCRIFDEGLLRRK